MSGMAFVFPVLESLDSGRLTRGIAGWYLRVQAILALIGGLVGMGLLMKVGFAERMPGEITFIVVVWTLLLLFNAVVLAQIHWYRASTVLDQGDSAYSVVPIVHQLLRCMGEVLASNLAVWGLGCFLALLLAPAGMTRGLNVELPPFLLGLLLLLAFLSLAFVVLMLFYFVAEVSLALVDIARQMRPGGLAAPGYTLAPGVTTGRGRCPSCSQEVLPGSAFCDHCGQRLVP